MRFRVTWVTLLVLNRVIWGMPWSYWILTSWQDRNSKFLLLDDNRARVTCEGGDTAGDWWHTWGNYSDIPAHSDHPQHRMSRPPPPPRERRERRESWEVGAVIGESDAGKEWQDEHSWEVRIEMRDTSDRSVNTDITHQNDQNAVCWSDTFVTFLTHSYCDIVNL